MVSYNIGLKKRSSLRVVIDRQGDLEFSLTAPLACGKVVSGQIMHCKQPYRS
jgi:hypothetical protein